MNATSPDKAALLFATMSANLIYAWLRASLDRTDVEPLFTSIPADQYLTLEERGRRLRDQQ